LSKQIPYILVAILAASIIVLFITGSSNRNRKFDPRITLRNRDKIPYGTYVAYQNLKSIFPGSKVFRNRRAPGYWDSLDTYGSGQVYISISHRFLASEEEFQKLLDFVESGNDVFISARYISADVERTLSCTTTSFELNVFTDGGAEKMEIMLNNPPFRNRNKYYYPGKKFNTYFSTIDTSITRVLGHDESGHPNFIQMKRGKGDLFLHLEPLAYCNYFLLHRENISYYEQTLSMLDADAEKIVWDDYYLYKRSHYDRPENKRSWLAVLFRYPALKAALLTAIFTLLLYAILEMRRKQRMIPVVLKPRNDSMDFAKTIGRLYHDKGDHKNLSKKMAAYFLEHVRNRYKLTTVNLDEEFIRNLRFKTNVEEHEIRGIVSFIKYLDDVPAINQKELIDFHKQLEGFYKKG